MLALVCALLQLLVYSQIFLKELNALLIAYHIQIYISLYTYTILYTFQVFIMSSMAYGN